MGKTNKKRYSRSDGDKCFGEEQHGERGIIAILNSVAREDPNKEDRVGRRYEHNRVSHTEKVAHSG